MLKKQRIEVIKALVLQKKIVSIDQLIEKLDTSESTVRRDLVDLEREGFLKRIHGGVQHNNKLKDEPIISTKLITNSEEKDVISRFAAELVEDGDRIFLDAGSTTYQLIPYLKGKQITVFTNGIMHIERLIDYQIDSYIIGGHIKPTTKAILGEEALRSLENYYFDKAFLGVNGISFENGFSTPDVKEAAIKKKVIVHTKDSYFLADHTKFNQSYFVKITDLDRVKVITNQQQTEFTDYIMMEVAK